MDDVDVANDRAQADLERQIAAAQKNVPHAMGEEFCQVCDERIPQARRRLGYSICVPCVATAEHLKKQYAGSA